MKRNVYSLVVSENKRPHLVQLERYNRRLKSQELSNRHPLDFIDKYTVQFNNEEDLLKDLYKKGIINSIGNCSVYVSYENKGVVKTTKVAYKDAEEIQNCSVSDEKSLINDVNSFDSLLGKCKSLYKKIGGEFITELNKRFCYNELLIKPLIEYIKNPNKISRDDVEDELKKYRIYRDLSVFCAEFNRKKHSNDSFSVNYAHQNEELIGEYYRKNLDGIITANMTENEIKLQQAHHDEDMLRIYYTKNGDEEYENFSEIEKKSKLTEENRKLKTKIEGLKNIKEKITAQEQSLFPEYENELKNKRNT